MSVFIDRKREFELLRERYASNKAEFVLLYGRRRVGKSELIEQFLLQKGVKGLKLLAREEAKKLQLEGFKKALADYFDDSFLEKSELANWDAFFEYVSTKAEDRFLLAIDEFPYLVKEDKSLPSVIQDYWDKKLRKSKVFLVLSGSSIRMMESLISYKSPLYGRRTGQLMLKPLRFISIMTHIGNLETSIQFYAVFGGTPAYIMEADLHKSLEHNIKEIILKEDAFLYRDVEFVLRQELDEPRYYFSILLSISHGNRKIRLICNDTGLSKSIVNKYLATLIDLQLVKRLVPVTESFNSKKGLYVLADNMFDFWFRFVFPHIPEVEEGRGAAVYEQHIRQQLSSYVGNHFEEVVAELISEVELFHCTKIGRWWHKDAEIDIVALNDETGEALFAECKWQGSINAFQVLNELKEKAKKVEWKIGKRSERFAIFAKSFGKRPQTTSAEMFFDLKDLQRMLAYHSQFRRKSVGCWKDPAGYRIN